MAELKKEQESGFKRFRNSFLVHYGLTYGFGFWIELKSGGTLYYGSEEHEQWLDDKKEEYLKSLGKG